MNCPTPTSSTGNPEYGRERDALYQATRRIGLYRLQLLFGPNTLVNIASELAFRAGFALAGAKALIILAGNGTTKVVP
jgi:hypothetical protein